MKFRMALKLTSVMLCMLHLAVALPARSLPEAETLHTLEDMEIVDDTVSVGSYIRRTRAAPSNDGEYYKSDEREGNGEIGYSRKKSGGGKKGYQHFDSYHKKAGDNYEFEKQDSYGLDEKGQDGAYSHRHERRAEREDERAREREPEEFEDDHEERNSHRKPKQRKEKQHSELREGAEDGNGGVEAVGHDPNDYILPEKYVYGNEAEEYDF